MSASQPKFNFSGVATTKNTESVTKGDAVTKFAEDININYATQKNFVPVEQTLSSQ